MLYDCNLKIYNSLNVQSNFNFGIFLLFVLEGNVLISINGKRKLYEANDLILINDLDRYSIITEHNTLIASLYFSRPELDHLFHFEKRYCINTSNLDFSLLKSKIIKSISSYINKRNLEQRSFLEFSNEIAMILHTFRVADYNHFYFNYSEIMKDMINAINFMDENYKQKLCISKIARKILMNERRFSKEIKKFAGKKYQDLLKQLRLSHSTYDLIYTSKKLVHIATDNGFTNESGFIEAFKKIYKITPGKFRRQIKNDKHLAIHNRKTKLVKDLSKVSNIINQLVHANLENVIMDINTKSVVKKPIVAPSFLMYITNVNTLTNHFQQSKLLALRRETGQFGLLFSHKIVNSMYLEKGERNKLIDQMFSFSLERQFEISFEIKFDSNKNDKNMIKKFEKFLVYLADCTYYYGNRNFKFYVDASIQEFMSISKIVHKYFKDTELILLLDKHNNYLASRMGHCINDSSVSYRMNYDTSFDKELTSIVNINPSLNILYQPKSPNKMDSLISIFNWSIQTDMKVIYIIDDSWLDSMIPSQTSALVIKEREQYANSQYQLLELLSMLMKLRGEVLFFNENVLITYYLYEFQILVMPNNKKSGIFHQRLNINQVNVEEIECRKRDLIIKSNQFAHQDEDTIYSNQSLNEVEIINNKDNLIVQFYSTADVIRHIYIKKKIN